MKKILIIILITLSMFTVGCKQGSIEDILKIKDNEITEKSEKENEIDKKNEIDKENEGETNTKDKSGAEQEKEQIPLIESKYTIKDFIGINTDEKYSYSGENSEFAEYMRYVDYIDGNKYQIRTYDYATEQVKVIEATETELKIVFKRGNCDYRENFLNKPANEDEILLKAPIAKGTEWKLSDGSKRYIASIDSVVATNIGEFQCIEVVTEKKDGYKYIQYYAPNYGLVKEVRDPEGMKVTSTLESIDKGAKLTQEVKFYYPDGNGEYMYSDVMEVSFSTNDITRLTLQNKFREKGILKDTVVINSLYLNDDGRVYLDVTKNFIPEMANGTCGEYFAIYNLVNTLGAYYNVQEVYITLDGDSYESGHITMDKWQSFKVDLSKVK